MSGYIAFIGPPGSGKTTQINLLHQVYPGPQTLIASVPRLIRQQPDLTSLLSMEERHELLESLKAARKAKNRGELAPLRLDALLFRAITRQRKAALVVMDGCPRGRRQAQLYLRERMARSRLQIVQLDFPCNEVEFSLQRQFQREQLKRGRVTALARFPIFRRKTAVYFEDTLSGVELLLKANVPRLRVCAFWPEERIHRTILEWIHAPGSLMLRSKRIAHKV